MRRALLAAALLATSALAVLPATAGAPDAGMLVVSGAGGSTGELVVREAVQLDPVVATLSGGDDYAGVLVEAQDGTTPLGLLQVRAFRDGTQSAVARLGAAVELPAGRYRVTVLGDGPVVARFALSDAEAPAVRVRTTKRLPVQFLGRADELLDGRSRASVLLPRSLPKGKRAVIATLMRGVRVDDLRRCATTGTTCPGAPVPVVGTDDTPLLQASIVAPSTAGVRNLVLSADGYREKVDSLRAVAIVF